MTAAATMKSSYKRKESAASDGGSYNEEQLHGKESAASDGGSYNEEQLQRKESAASDGGSYNEEQLQRKESAASESEPDGIAAATCKVGRARSFRFAEIKRRST